MRKIYLTIALTLFLFASCSEDSERSKGLVNVFIIGSHGEFDEIWLEVLGVEIKTTGTRGMDNADPVFLANTQTDKKINVASLTANSQVLLGRGEFSEANITEITLKFGDDHYAVINGQRFPISFASNSSAEPKFLINYDIFGGISHDIFLDFDAFQSFELVEGPEPRFILEPQIRPFLSLNTGRASGRISPANQKVAIFAVENEQLISTTGSQASSGDFALRGLEENKRYKVYIFPFSNNFLPDTLDSVSVNLRQNTALGTITLRPVE